MLLAVAVSSCAASFPALDVKSTPAPEAWPDKKSVVLLSEQEARFQLGEKGPEVITTERLRVKVLRPAEMRPLQVGYSRTFEEVVSIRGRVISPDGTEKPLDVSKQVDLPAIASTVLFSDTRVVVVPVPSIPVGGVYETEVVTRHRDMQHFVVTQTFGDVEPTVIDRLVVLAPKGWELRWKLLAYDGTAIEPVESERDGLRQWVFERRDLPALEVEPQGPTLRVLKPRLTARIETWKDGNGAEHHPPPTAEDLSRMLAQGDDERRARTPELEATVAKVLTGVEDTPEAKARALYEHTCREVQYCAIEVGFGGWYPHAAKDVHAARYGDCKDKANYLNALLNIAGLTAYSVSIYSHDGTPQAFGLPSLGSNFNHQISAVKLGDKLVFADPTWRAVPFGELPPNDQGAPVLLISKEGHALQTTPESQPSQNTEVQRYQLTLDAQGDGSGTFSLTATGARALPWKMRFIEGTGQAKRWVQDQLWLKAPVVRSVKNQTASDFAKVVEVTGELAARRLAFDAAPGQQLVRPLDVLDPWVRTWKTERKVPVIERFTETRSQLVELTLPTGAKLVSTPVDRSLDGPHGTYRLRVALEGQVLKLERTFVRNRRRMQPSELDASNTFTSQVLTLESQPVLYELPRRAEVSR